MKKSKYIKQEHYIRLIYLGLILLFSCINMEGQTKRAFLVGISNYDQNTENAWCLIHGANDVELLSPTLKRQGFKINKLCNKAATANKIRKNLASLASSCRAGDIVYIHFSCHGQPVEDLDGDEDDGWDEAIVPYDAQKVYQKGIYTGENHIIDDELNDYLRSIRTKVGPKGFVYMTIDACHAGSSYRGEEEDRIIVRGTNRGFTPSGKPFAPKIDKRGNIKIEKSPEMANICVLEACRSYQVNSEIREKGIYYGSLSFYVNKALQTSSFDRHSSWADRARQLMDADVRLVRQNVVIEYSF